MAEGRLVQLSDTELERALEELGTYIDYPPPPELAGPVATRIQSEGTVVPLQQGRRRRITRGVALGLAAAVVVGGAAAAARLGIRGISIEVVASPAPTRTVPALGRNLFLGNRTTLLGAAAEVSYRIVRPRAPDLPEPQVYLSYIPEGGRVSFVYPSGPRLPRTEETGVGMLITEFRADVQEDFIQKIAFEGNTVESVTVNGEAGFWITGTPHEVLFVRPDGQPFADAVRLAGNTLVWQHGPLAIRLESELSKAEALRIARSVR